MAFTQATGYVSTHGTLSAVLFLQMAKMVSYPGQFSSICYKSFSKTRISYKKLTHCFSVPVEKIKNQALGRQQSVDIHVHSTMNSIATITSIRNCSGNQSTHTRVHKICLASIHPYKHTYLVIFTRAATDAGDVDGDDPKPRDTQGTRHSHICAYTHRRVFKKCN